MRKNKGIRSIRCVTALVLALAVAGCGAAGTQEAVTTVAPTPAEEVQEELVVQEPPAEEEQKEETADAAETSTQDVSKEEEEEEDVKTTPFLIIPKDLPDNEAIAFTMGLGAGYNLGNTFDAYVDSGLAADHSDEMKTETAWHGVETTREIIHEIAAGGFGYIRIPVSWHNHILDDNVTISPVFLDRVNEVVDWALDEGLYVIINIHHDNHPEANGFYPDSAHAAQSKKYVSRIWQQVAERFKDYDDHLIFESLNEPRLVGHENEWWFTLGSPSADVKDSIACINELNQIFLDTVRSVDGPHRTCYVMCPGYDASTDGATVSGFKLPTDAPDIENRVILAVHEYKPYSFALEEGGTDAFNSIKYGDVQDINAFADKLYVRYVQKGIPVIIGEFGARDRGGNTAARADFAGYYTAKCWSCGIPCTWWDNGALGGDGEVFAILDRRDCTWAHPEIKDALVEYAKPFSEYEQ